MKSVTANILTGHTGNSLPKKMGKEIHQSAKIDYTSGVGIEVRRDY